MPDWLGQGRYLPTWDGHRRPPSTYTPSYIRALTRARKCFVGNGPRDGETRVPRDRVSLLFRGPANYRALRP